MTAALDEVRIVCPHCLRQVGAYTGEGIEIRHRGRIVFIPYTSIRVDDRETFAIITCEDCKRELTIYSHP